MIPLSFYLILSALLFGVGLFGVVSRKNAIAILMSVELMLNAANINFIAFWRYFEAAGNAVNGQMFTAAVFVVAAAEVAVGLALIISVWRQRHQVDADQLDMLKW